MDEKYLVELMAFLMIVSGVLCFFTICLGFRAGYGRYNTGSILTIPSGLDWFLQESPSLFISGYYLFTCTTSQGMYILFLFVAHYTQRSLYYPYVMKSSKGSPWYIFVLAVAFCSYNGYMQGVWHAKYYSWEREGGFFSDCLTWLGTIVFFLGMAVNIHSDAILRNLRKPGETGYKIPRGGLFEYVSGANYFGEIIEWMGYALVARSLPAVAFFAFTVSNIGPRAIQHHKFYLEKFEDYPKSRKALIPFIY